MMYVNRITISLVLGAAIAAPTLLFTASTSPEQQMQINRAELQQVLMMIIPSDASPLRKASCEAMTEGYRHSLQEQKLPEQIIGYKTAQYRTQMQTIGTLVATPQQPEKLYNFLAPDIYRMQQRLASTSMGLEAMINVLEHPEEQAAITVLVNLFQKHPEKIAAYYNFIKQLETACGIFFTPHHAMSLQFAIDQRKQLLAVLSDKTLSAKDIESSLLNRNQDYNSFRKRFAEAPKTLCRKIEPLIRLALTPCATMGAQALGWTALHPYLMPIATPIAASLTYKSLSATFACLFGRHFFAPDDTREALLAATKLAPFLYPFGLSREINTKAPLTIENAHLVLRRFRVAGYMDVAINIVNLLNAGHAIPCVSTASSQTSLQQGMAQLWQATTSKASSCLFGAVSPNTFGIQKDQHSEQEAFDLFILNTVTAQAFNIAFNFAHCSLAQISLPKIEDMQFLATRCYHGAKTGEAMHTMMVKI